MTINLRASTAADRIDIGVLPENPFADTVHIACVESEAWPLSTPECHDGIFAPFLSLASRTPVITSALAAAALKLPARMGDPSGGAIFTQFEGVAAFWKIGMAAFAAWLLSLMAWQVIDTAPQSYRRGRGYPRSLPAAILRSTAAISRS